VTHVEMAGFIIFSCLSTFHPLLAKLFSSRTKQYGDFSSFDMKEQELNESGTKSKEKSIQPAAGKYVGPAHK
jgi:hypothetical protein